MLSKWLHSLVRTDMLPACADLVGVSTQVQMSCLPLTVSSTLLGSSGAFQLALALSSHS